MKTVISIFFIFVFQIGQILSQEIKQGVVTYKVTDFEIEGKLSGEMSPDDAKELKGFMAPMIAELKQTIAWDEDSQYIEINLAGILTNKIFTDLKKHQNITYMDLMGQKYKIVSDIPPMNSAALSTKEFISDSKIIAGYKCYKVVYSLVAPDFSRSIPEHSEKENRETNNVELTAYITDLIKPSAYLSLIQGTTLKGLPLEFNLSLQGMNLKLEATEVKTKVDKKLFIQPTGYQEMTIAEFEQMMAKLGK